MELTVVSSATRKKWLDPRIQILHRRIDELTGIETEIAALRAAFEQHERVIAELKDLLVRLKLYIALAERKAEHGCTDANCDLCHEEEGDGTW